ncbi:ATP-binding protein [Cellulomonas rhizosphaerae]|uniref:ATP-binding protein n=1 Tax=Cellulomonas rhizosphaerae TaxID=2293719 RepID=UPI0018F2C633|nr:ATP-binding protein [Cellulomonas rhizosphaerae]
MNSQTTPPDDGASLDGGLRTSRPPASFVPVHRWVIDSLGELSALRHALQDQINTRDHAATDRDLGQVAQDLVLVASELATNAIRHGRPPTIVQLLQDGPRFLLTVADRDLGSEPRIAGDRPPGEGGFGLQIARRLSREVGWYRTDAVKVIWAEIGA